MNVRPSIILFTRRHYSQNNMRGYTHYLNCLQRKRGTKGVGAGGGGLVAPRGDREKTPGQPDKNLAGG